MKTIRLTLAVAAEKLADVIEALDGLATLELGSSKSVDVAEDVEEPVMARKRVQVPAKMVAAMPNRGGNRGPVVYTPAGTQRQIEKTLAGLRKNTLGAFVLADIVKHPGTSKRDMLARLEKPLAKHGLSTESVDNVVWNMQKRNIVKSVPAND